MRRIDWTLSAAGTLFLLLAWHVLPAFPGTVGEVTLYRDTWGVPHIYGDTREAAAYGSGYAQAQDRLDDILTVYRAAEGRAAGVFGKAWVQRDYEARIARHAEVARKRYNDLSPESRRLIEYYLSGVYAYMREHPEEVPAWADPPKPYNVVALYRSFIWGWPRDQALDDLRRTGPRPGAGRGSNQWTVGPGRSAEGGPIALIDPHLPWTPENRFYEAHVHGGDLDFYGFSIIGTPLMAVGHTDVLSFAYTTGGPDCADIYLEKINPEDPMQYEYDGQWRPIQVEKVTIEVKTSEGMRIEKRRIERTHHGPILKRKDNRAYTARTAYDSEIGFIDQWLGMVRARNLGEFLNAMRQNQAPPQNIMYADIYGNTYYIRAGRVPIRPAGFRWDRPVPGYTSRSEWLGIHPLSDLVQILNPPSGYMQNCNVSPDVMMPNSPLTPDRYPSYIYNARADAVDARGRRALELLGAEERLTTGEALRIAVDTYVDRADRWQQALEEAQEVHKTPFAHLHTASHLLLDWDGRMDIESPAAALFRFWMRACRERNSGVPIRRIESGKPLAGGAQAALLKALDRAVEEMEGRTGRIDIPWGDVHRAGRGGRTWPVGGCEADGISTLRSVSTSPPDEKGVSRVHGGQFCTTVVLLREGNVASYSAVPYGQSNHPDSPHYTDQGEKLFSAGKLKPTWYRKADLLQNLESRQTLTVPELP